MLDLLLVVLGGAVGAPARYLVDRWVQRNVVSHHARRVALGTLTVNVLGSALLGVVVAVADHPVTLLAGTGFCGAFTTFSTFAAQADESVRAGWPLVAATNVVGSLVLCVTAFAVTWGLLR